MNMCKTKLATLSLTNIRNPGAHVIRDVVHAKQIRKQYVTDRKYPRKQ